MTALLIYYFIFTTTAIVGFLLLYKVFDIFIDWLKMLIERILK